MELVLLGPDGTPCLRSAVIKLFNDFTILIDVPIELVHTGKGDDSILSGNSNSTRECVCDVHNARCTVSAHHRKTTTNYNTAPVHKRVILPCLYDRVSHTASDGTERDPTNYTKEVLDDLLNKIDVILVTNGTGLLGVPYLSQLIDLSSTTLLITRPSYYLGFLGLCRLLTGKVVPTSKYQRSSDNNESVDACGTGACGTGACGTGACGTGAC
eukprot:Lankesteria_metandrocarpae@DN6160_c0_g1_i1.p1